MVCLILMKTLMLLLAMTCEQTKFQNYQFGLHTICIWDPWFTALLQLKTAQVLSKFAIQHHNKMLTKLN